MMVMRVGREEVVTRTKRQADAVADHSQAAATGAWVLCTWCLSTEQVHGHVQNPNPEPQDLLRLAQTRDPPPSRTVHFMTRPAYSFYFLVCPVSVAQTGEAGSDK